LGGAVRQRHVGPAAVFFALAPVGARPAPAARRRQPLAYLVMGNGEEREREAAEE